MTKAICPKGKYTRWNLGAVCPAPALYSLTGDRVPFNPPIPDPKPRGNRSSIVGSIIQAEKMVQIALILPCAAFIGWLAGAWIGSRIHLPWLGAVGIILGGAAGLIYVIRMAMDAVNDPRNGGDPKNGGGGAGSDGAQP